MQSRYMCTCGAHWERARLVLMYWKGRACRRCMHCRHRNSDDAAGLLMHARVGTTAKGLFRAPPRAFDAARA